MWALAVLLFAAVTLAAFDTVQVPLGLDSFIPVPESNPITREKVALGRKLFFDTRLSRDNSVSCATCHDPKRAFTDERKTAVGIAGRTGPRRVPAILNRGYGKSFFWDGRAATLEQQVVQPIVNPKEMDMPLEEAAARAGMTKQALAEALACYVRTIVAGDSPYDRYVVGERTALSADQLAGLRIFRGKANCAGCHLGPNLTDERFHNTGLAGEDEGRFAVTRELRDRGSFKTPTLRQVAAHPPYMHDGSLASLEEVIDYYDRGGNRNPNLDAEIQPLHLTMAEKQALGSFLRALSGVVREGL